MKPGRNPLGIGFLVKEDLIGIWCYFVSWWNISWLKIASKDSTTDADDPRVDGLCFFTISLIICKNIIVLLWLLGFQHFQFRFFLFERQWCFIGVCKGTDVTGCYLWGEGIGHVLFFKFLESIHTLILDLFACIWNLLLAHYYKLIKGLSLLVRTCNQSYHFGDSFPFLTI